MKNLLTFQLFEDRQLLLFKEELTKEQKKFLDQKVIGTWSYDEKTGLVNIEGSLHCELNKSNDFNGIKFGHVTKDFRWISSKLSSLKGAPHTVDGSVSIFNNRLVSLEGGPEKVKDSYACQENRLKTLLGAPRKVSEFDCSSNLLESLEGGPIEVKHRYDCRRNHLKSLKGAPRMVENFDCQANDLRSLEGAPRKLNAFDCSENFLTSLEGGPEILTGGFYAQANPLVSLSGLPSKLASFKCGAFSVDLAVYGSKKPVIVTRNLPLIWDALVSSEWGRYPYMDVSFKQKTIGLLLTITPDEVLDRWMLDNVVEIQLLEKFPKVQKGVIERTGIKKKFGELKNLLGGGMI